MDSVAVVVVDADFSLFCSGGGRGCTETTSLSPLGGIGLLAVVELWGKEVQM